MRNGIDDVRVDVGEWVDVAEGVDVRVRVRL